MRLSAYQSIRLAEVAYRTIRRAEPSEQPTLTVACSHFSPPPLSLYCQEQFVLRVRDDRLVLWVSRSLPLIPFVALHSVSGVQSLNTSQHGRHTSSLTVFHPCPLCEWLSYLIFLRM